MNAVGANRPGRIIGLMLVRNEQWVIGASLTRALEWCDAVIVCMHRCVDLTHAIVRGITTTTPRHPETKQDRVYTMEEPAAEWDEMDVRQRMLDAARGLGATHIALVDADELLTDNLLSSIRGFFGALTPGELLNLPMVAVWKRLVKYRNDESVWARARLTVGFCDRADLVWQPRDGGYQHHCRAPVACEQGINSEPIPRGGGGVMHLQFANRRRLIAKHWLYAYTDHVRWPGRRNPEQLNRIYSEALMNGEEGLADLPSEWVRGLREDWIAFDEPNPWQREELRAMLARHGEEAFAGITLSEARPV